MKKSSYKQFSVALMLWFNQKWAERMPVSHTMYTVKAKSLHKAVALQGEFNASSVCSNFVFSLLAVFLQCCWYIHTSTSSCLLIIKHWMFRPDWSSSDV
jgi:hypothetical protein